MQVFHSNINTHSADIFKRFLKGENLEPVIIDQVVTDLGGSKYSYDNTVAKVKGIINASKKENIYHMFVFTTKELKEPLNRLEKAIFIRLVNLPYKDLEAFILINDEIVYFSEFYDTQGNVVIEEYVVKMLKDLTLKRKKIEFKAKIKKALSWNPFSQRVKELV